VARRRGAGDATRLAALTAQLGPKRDANSDESKAMLKRNTDEALQLGVFGTPAYCVDGRLFWGFDGLAMLRAYLSGDAWFDGPQWTEADQRPALLEEKKVIFASSLGTVFEWYDFYLYGSLAAIIAKQFFSGLDPTSAFIFALLAFAAGFLVRPFGAIVFGRLGDMIGRKYTFLVTILIMGLSTFIVGLLPNYASIGVAAPVILIALRMLQGLALGGEYGGAATYVAEHAPHGKRGAYTSWIQTTATLGLFLSLLVILGVREAWARRLRRLGLAHSVPGLDPAAGVSVWIRLSLNESPAFQKMKAEGKTSKAPLSESFGQWKNLKIVILALVGLTAGQAVVWYTGQFYALFFLTHAEGRRDHGQPDDRRLAADRHAVLRVFGTLSDKIGRKPIIMAGCLLAVLTYFPVFKMLTKAANPDLAARAGQEQGGRHGRPEPVLVPGQPDRHREIDFTSSCDIAKRALLAGAR
jgi:MFS family permease